MTDAIVRHHVAMITSLQDAIIKAGGRPFTWDELRNMTLDEIVSMFGPNGIRYCHKEQPDD